MNLSDFPSQFIENGVTNFDKLAFYADLERIDTFDRLIKKLQDEDLIALSGEGVGWGDPIAVFGEEGKKASQVKMENYEAFMRSPQYFKLGINVTL